jgi:ribose transport system ATP-binding protein
MRKEVFRADNVIFRRGGVSLLDRFSVHVFEGEIFGLFFSDNNGKDEFVKLAMNNHPIDYGKVYFMDEQVNSYTLGRPSQNPNARIGYVSRAASLIDDMSVAENVFLMRRGFRKYIIDEPVLNAQFAALASEYGIDIEGNAYVRDLSRYERYIIRILKSVVAGSSLVIVRNLGMEYGSAELLAFQKQVRRFAMGGVSFIYISGDIRILTDMCDRVTVTEGGRVVTTAVKSKYFTKKLDRWRFYPDGIFNPPPVDRMSLLRFSDVTGGALNGLDFSVASGESVLLWDRSDRVLRDVLAMLSRSRRPESGEIRFKGAPLPGSGRGSRISFISESPTRSMIFGEMSCMDNLCMRMAERAPSLWLGSASRRIIMDDYREMTGDDIDADPADGLPAESLYRLVYLREYIYRPQLLVLEKPFLETDVRLRHLILSLITMFRDRGTSILILDSSMSDSGVVADRTLSVAGGRVTGERIRTGEEESA